MIRSLLALFCFMSATSVLAGDSLQARMERQDKVIKVLPIKGYKAPKLTIDLLVDVPIAKITQVVGACSDYVGVIPRVQKVIVHKKGIPNHVCELFLDMPFPFADLRSTIAYSGTMTANEVVMRYRQIKGDYRLHNGLWRLRAQGKRTHIHYSLHIDLGKPLPTWVINIFTKDALRQTVSEVTRRARSLLR